jgi:hypothetical protein
MRICIVPNLPSRAWSRMAMRSKEGVVLIAGPAGGQGRAAEIRLSRLGASNYGRDQAGKASNGREMLAQQKKQDASRLPKSM